MEVGREADKGMPRARYCMCAFQFDLTPLISLLGRRSTAQGNGRGYYIAAAARWNKVRLRPRAHIFESDLTPLPPHLCSHRMQEHGSAAAARTKVCPRALL